MQKSFGLVEVMVSVLILVVGISGSIAVLNNIVNNFRLATDVFISKNLAVEGIEIVRNIRDNNLLAGIAWNHGLTITPPYHQVDFNDPSLVVHVGPLYMDTDNFFQHTTTANKTPFSRKIKIASCGVGCLEIRSTVTWISFVEEERTIIVTRLFEH